MTLTLLLAALFAVATYIAANRLRPARRLMLAAAVLVIPPLALVGLVVYVGDQPVGCSQMVEVQNGELVPVGPADCD